MSDQGRSVIQPSSSGLGAATLSRLRRISMMRSTTKPRTIGSGSEFDAMLADSGLTRASLSLDRGPGSPKLSGKAQTDGHGNRILGGELVVKVWDAQVSAHVHTSAICAISQEKRYTLDIVTQPDTSYCSCNDPKTALTLYFSMPIYVIPKFLCSRVEVGYSCKFDLHCRASQHHGGRSWRVKQSRVAGQTRSRS